jgi:integrase
MATFQKRGTSWRALIRRKGAKAITGTFDTKAEAEKWATKIEAEILDGGTPEEAVQAVKSEGVSAADLFSRYAETVSIDKKGARWEQIRLKMLARRWPLFQKPVLELTGPDMADWRDERLKEVKASSVNRELNLMSGVFTRAIKEWRIGMAVNPISLISRPKNPPSRTQRVSMDERLKIIAKLGWDGKSLPQDARQWAAYAMYLALETAMRKGEILSLRWRDISFDECYAHLGDTKNGDERFVPLSNAAIKLLMIAKDRSPDLPVVPLQSGYLDRLVREARQEANLTHVKFHDTRREAATTMAPKLSNVLELAAITGHRSLKTLMVYYKPTARSLADKLNSEAVPARSAGSAGG